MPRNVFFITRVSKLPMYKPLRVYILYFMPYNVHLFFLNLANTRYTQKVNLGRYLKHVFVALLWRRLVNRVFLCESVTFNSEGSRVIICALKFTSFSLIRRWRLQMIYQGRRNVTQLLLRGIPAYRAEYSFDFKVLNFL